MCDHGDDGGTLSATTIRAQVLSYSPYFSNRGNDRRALHRQRLGEASFAPGRAREVFVPDVLEDGILDERAATQALRTDRRILRES